MRTLSYYRPPTENYELKNILISGQCALLKNNVVSRSIREAKRNRMGVVVIDLAKKADFRELVADCGYDEIRTYRDSTDTYEGLAETDTNASIRLKAVRRGYSHAEYAGISRLLDILQEVYTIETGMSKPLLEDVLNRYSIPDDFETVLVRLLRNGKINRQTMNYYLQAYFEEAQNGIIIDRIIYDQKQVLSPALSENIFTFRHFAADSAAIIYGSDSNHDNRNQYLTEQLTEDLKYVSGRIPLLIIANTDDITHTELLSELSEVILKKHNSCMVYCSDNIFGMNNTEDVLRFCTKFPYNIFGRHNGHHAEMISLLFSDYWATKQDYTVTKDYRLSTQSIADMILHTNYSNSFHYSYFKDRVVPANHIARLSASEGILLNTVTGEFERISSETDY